MEFQTFKFLIFFAVVFAVFWRLTNHRWRLAWLLFASCYFYMSWNPWLIGLILLSATVDYVVALQLDGIASLPIRRLLLAGSIGCNLGLLGFFKYVNFFLDSAGAAGGFLGLDVHTPVLDVVLPLGISFYTFETISYIVDVYLGRAKPVRNPLDYALYIMFFPHLIAGPIVRPRDFLPQLQRPKRFSWARMQLGVEYFLLGLVKKAVIADFLATLAEPMFKAPGLYASQAVWLAVLAYAGQIYCDFSGYSDMAVGTAHMLGFKLPKNFNMPYFAANITEFWRRWHMSLSTWLRDYLYIPLGGNRHGVWSTYRNLLLTMVLGGLWHGANWTFMAWGLYHGLLLAVHRAWPWKERFALPRPLAVMATFLLVCVGWVFFRAQSFADVGTILTGLFWPRDGIVFEPMAVVLAWTCLGGMLAAHLFGTHVKVKPLWPRMPAPLMGAALACFLILALLLMHEDGAPFIYFHF